MGKLRRLLVFLTFGSFLMADTTTLIDAELRKNGLRTGRSTLFSTATVFLPGFTGLRASNPSSRTLTFFAKPSQNAIRMLFSMS